MDGDGQSCRSLKAKEAQRRWYHDRTSGDFRWCLLCDPSVHGLGAQNDNKVTWLSDRHIILSLSSSG